MKQVVSTDDPRLDPSRFVFPEQRYHRLRQHLIVDDAGRSPQAGASNWPLLPPPPHDDDEIVSAEDRAAMVAGGPDS